MSITASCGNCGKSYQAPDRLAGKIVRCKGCGETFRIDADVPADAEGLPDLDALERSFSGDELSGTSASTAVGGPTIDAKGKVRIERSANVDELPVHGSAGANALRSNFRLRYPGAKQVDQFLPWVLVVLTGYLVARACLNTSDTVGEPVSTGVALSRLACVLGAYLIVVWPISHIALRMATTKLRMSMPRAALWRSFASFTPVLLLGAGLYTSSGGSVAALVMGLLVGVLVAIGVVTVLFRMFPNEVPTASGYVAGGSLAGAAFAAALLFAINLVGSAIARIDKNPTLFVSPVAIGLPWVEKPALQPKIPVVAKKDAPRVAPPTTTSAAIVANQQTTSNPSDATAAAGNVNAAPPAPPVSTTPQPVALQTMPVPRPEGQDVALVKRVEFTPVIPGFDQVITTPVASNAIAVIRAGAGGVIECWDHTTWRQPAGRPGVGFDLGQGSLVVNPAARLVVRLVRNPTDRIEQIPLGNTSTMAAVSMTPGFNRSPLGFVNDAELIVRVNDAGELALERYDLNLGKLVGGQPKFAMSSDGKPAQALEVDPIPTSVRMVPDGSAILVAGRDRSSPDMQAVLALYDWDDFSAPYRVRNVPWRGSGSFRPIGLAITLSGRAALLMDAGGEAYLTTWELRDRKINGARIVAQDTPVLDRKFGSVEGLKVGYWSTDSDPLLWIDDKTLLLFGNLIIDANTGITIGRLGIPGVMAQFPAGDGAILMVIPQNRMNVLVRVTLDRAAIDAARNR